MSFSADVKRELAKIIPPAQHCRIVAQAVLQYASSEGDDLARQKYFTLVKKTSTIETLQKTADPGSHRVPEQLLAHACCRKSLLRETFLLAGTISDPERDYHMEFQCADDAQAKQLIDVLAGFSVEARSVQRKGHPAVYLKDSAAMVDVLNLMGAHRSLMKMENALIRKEMRNTINRQVN